jgi:hypothetical protein
MIPRALFAEVDLAGLVLRPRCSSPGGKAPCGHFFIIDGARFCALSAASGYGQKAAEKRHGEPIG